MKIPGQHGGTARARAAGTPRPVPGWPPASPAPAAGPPHGLKKNSG